MLDSLFYLAIAIIALGFLIFIHELGHYFMARRVGMRVEAFGIGFGKAIYKWGHDGVEWRLNWIPFGGYVKIKGAETDEEVDPYKVPDGFFGRPPLDRIKVSLAGPLANLLVALVVFVLLWITGGREKSYSEFSNKIGWVDPTSELYADGVRPGDEITFYEDHAFSSSKDHLYEALTAQESLRIRGAHVDYLEGAQTPFDVTVSVYPHPRMVDKSLKTAGILDSASFLVYEPVKTRSDTSLVDQLAQGSPFVNSGIQPGDRIIWANGELVFSQPELSFLINEDRALLTVDRAGKVLLRRVPRVAVQELRLDSAYREEVVDWQHEAGLQQIRTSKLEIIPYNLTHDAVVEDVFSFIDTEAQDDAFPHELFSTMEEPLKPGDKIVAINGEPIHAAHELIAKLQQPKMLVIVLRNPAEENQRLLWTQANKDFFHDVNWSQLETIIQGIGVPNGAMAVGNLVRLNPMVPKTHAEFATTPEAQSMYANKIRETRKELEDLEDPEKRAHALELLDKSERLLHLGPPYLQDKQVVYNPGPFTLFANVFDEIWRTLQAFATGTLSPKWVVGPIGLVQVIQQNWSSSLKEGLFWIGLVSLNLGVLNLLPIPVLDGGSICFSLFELVTGRKVKIKTLEKLVVPFAILLMVFFVFLTYNDVSRIVGRLMGW